MNLRRTIAATLWIVGVLLPCLLLAFVSIVVVSPREVGPSALSFMLALPMALVSLKWARASAIGFVLLLLLDIFTANWARPHAVADFFHSTVDVMLLLATALTVTIAVLIPAGGLIRGRAAA